jgi:hypothetical protein
MPLNGRGLTGADYQDQQLPVDGAPGGWVKAKPKANPLAPQQATLLFGGTETDGTYSQAFTAPDGTTLTIAVVRATTPATNADLAAQLVANAQADDDWANVATFEVDGGTAEQVNVLWLHPSEAYPLGATAAPAPGTLTPAITANAGGAPVPVGRFLIAVANVQSPDVPAAGLPLVGSAATDIIGFSARDGSYENSGLPGAERVEQIPAAQEISSGYYGPWYATNHGAVAAEAEGAVFAVRNVAGGDPLGGARSDADGGNTVALTRAQAYWLDRTPPGARGRIFLGGL